MSGANSGDLRGRGSMCFWYFTLVQLNSICGDCYSISDTSLKYEDSEKNNNLSRDLKKLTVIAVHLQGKCTIAVHLQGKQYILTRINLISHDFSQGQTKPPNGRSTRGSLPDKMSRQWEGGISRGSRFHVIALD